MFVRPDQPEPKPGALRAARSPGERPPDPFPEIDPFDAVPPRAEGHLTGHGTLTDPHGTAHGTRHPGLRLVRHELSPSVAPPRADADTHRRRAAEVLKENRRSASLSANDARRIMAQRVAEHLDGGRAGILVPDRRRALVSTAQRLGLRPFDANLIIAIVQDRFRRGLLGAVGAAGDDRLDLIPHPALVERRRERFWTIVRMVLASASIAVVLAVCVMNWITGGKP